MTHKKQAACVPRRYPVGAEIIAGGVSFRVWAPSRKQVNVVLDADRHELKAEAEGYFSTIVKTSARARYSFQLDDDMKLYPDPASRYQPDGPHGSSQVVNPQAYSWRNSQWRGSSLKGQVVYEMHVGTFSEEGTWAGAAGKLPLLRDVGITLIEMMPVHDFPGRFGWGYDGTNFFAPCRLYGEPNDLRSFIDTAHGLDIGVILDVVYNHVGPDGNYLSKL